ncbi:plasma protease C1 inhibitor [Polypterus senegalus]|nr:plasma protease C1 inhibitor [Polypterus senegalus]
MKAAEKPDANVVFSPFSIASTLSLLLLGARGESRRDLEKELRYPENFSCIHEEMRHVAKTSLNLLTASKIFHRADIEMQPFFINQSQEFYGVLPEQLTNESSVNTEMINQWVSEKTQHKITTLVDNVGLDTDIIILNAIYYQGTWLTQFDPENTTMDSFRSPDKTVQVQMMKSENYKLFIKNDFHLKAKVAKFQLSGRTSLLVLLPFDSTPNSLVDLESKLELDTFLKLMRDLNAAELTDAMVALPKIILDTKTDLTWLLGDMMNFMHSYKSPNLCGMTPQNPLLISDSQHRAVIELSESGVEAAAATSVSVARTINVFEANHPFIFILWDEKNEVPLIMGQVVDPTSTS